MALTPMDIHSKEFAKSFRGYNEEEVDQFLDQIIEEFEKLHKENLEVREANNSLRVQLDAYVSAEQNIDERLKNAEIQTDVMINEAKNKTLQILQEANENAEIILQEAKEKAESLEDIYKEQYTKAAQQKSQLLIAEAEQKASSILESSQEEIEILKKDLLSEIRNEAERTISSMLKEAEIKAESLLEKAREEGLKVQRTIEENAVKEAEMKAQQKAAQLIDAAQRQITSIKKELEDEAILSAQQKSEEYLREAERKAKALLEQTSIDTQDIRRRLEEQILKDGQEKADQIVHQAKERARRILESANHDALQIRKEFDEIKNQAKLVILNAEERAAGIIEETEKMRQARQKPSETASSVRRPFGTKESLHIPKPGATESDSIHPSDLIPVDSMRLDIVLGMGFKMSGVDVLRFIKERWVRVNWEVVENPDFLLSTGDVIHVQGMGTAVVSNSEQRGSSENPQVTLEIYY